MTRTPRPPIPGILIQVLLLLILLLAFALRFHDLDGQSLWNDEGTSMALAGRDPAAIARDAAQDIHPPLYYWLLSGWVRLTGNSEFAARGLSAMLGVIVVALVYTLGRLLAGRWAGLAAALLAAINPFQVLYAQEARMYMLLAVWSALAFCAALRWAGQRSGEGGGRWAALYVVASAAGLYTHYAFPLVLLAVNGTILLYIALKGQSQAWDWQSRSWWGWLWRWLLLQAAALLLFLPWLPVAIRQLLTWPRVEEAYDLVAALTQITQLFSTGPAAPAWVETGLALLLLLVVFYPPPRTGRLPGPVAYAAPVLWLAAPVALVLGFGLFKEAYLKFLLVASPAFCLLAGRFVTAPLHRKRWAVTAGEAVLCGVIGVLLVSASAHGLHHYYNNPAYARDDYRGMASYIEAVGRPGDAVLLNAPGQQEVFGYYYDGDLPVYPLPEGRPLDPAATEAALAGMARAGGRVYALFWATDESDPGRLVEGWLDAHAYKALDSWHGNVRLAVYAMPAQAPETADRALDVVLRNGENGDEIRLLGYSLLNDRLAAGDIAQLTLFWQAERTPARRYKVFVHVLDGGNQIVGQRDAEPGGGARLTTLWPPGGIVVDNYGVPIHPATPPGAYRVEVGLYDAETGLRLTTSEGEGQVWLEPLAVERPTAPAPTAALGMEHAAGAEFGALTLLGYDAHRLGFAHQPDAPLRPGDVLHVNLYWRAEVAPGGDWRVDLALVDADGRRAAGLVAEPVGQVPTGEWRPGDVWRGQFNLPLPGDLPAGRYWLWVQPATPDGTLPEAFRSEPLNVGR